MTSTINKIIHKAHNLRLKSSLGYNGKDDCVPFAEYIIDSPKFPNFYFLVTENMIFKHNYLDDSCYKVYSFDANGDFIREENPKELGRLFFKKMNILKKIA